MKKFLFLLVSVVLAGATYCTSAKDKVVAKVAKSDKQIQQQQKQSLILEQPSAKFGLLADHYSHSSHSSHSSHYSSRFV